MEKDGIKILAVDDNADNITSLKAIISVTFPEATTTTALSGSEALALAEIYEPDIVLLDILMPGMDGFEVCKKLKSDKKLRDIPVLFITSLKEDCDNRIRALEAGGEGFLSKPIDECDFTFQVQFMMKLRKANLEKRSESQELLRESKLQLESAIRASNTGLWDWNLRTGKVYYSPEWKWQIGYKPDEIRDDFSEWKSRVHPDDVETAEALVNTFINSPWPNFENKFRFRHKNGSYIWILAKASLVCNEQGIPVRMLGSHVDISTLKQSEDRYRNLFEQMMNGFALHEIILNNEGIPFDYRFLEVNRAFEKLTGLLASKIIGRRVREVLPDIEHEFIDIYGKVALDQQPVRFRKYTHELNKTFEITAYSTEKGTFATVFEDVTDRVAAEYSIRVSEEKYRNLFEHMAEGLAYCKMVFEGSEPVDWIYLSVNKRFENLTGLREVIGRRVTEVIPGIKEIDPHLFEIYGRVASTGIPEKFEIEVKSLDIWFNVSVYSPAREFFIAVFEVITERKKAEAEIRRAKEIMDEYHKHLTEAREKERADISRELHDQLGQSLTALKLDLNWILENIQENPEISKKLPSMVSLTSSTIQDIQRISTDLRPGLLDDIGLAATIEWYTEEFEKRSGIPVEKQLEEIQSSSDFTNLSLFRVLQESLTNVIRHSKAENVSVILKQNLGDIILEIKDDGVGIPNDKIKSPHSLGIVGMNERINQSHGILKITSEPGKGTHIRIQIPAEGKEKGL